MSKQFATLLIDRNEILLSVFEPDEKKVSYIKSISVKISDPKDHKFIQKSLRELRTNNPDLPDKFFAVWPEYKTLTGVFSGIGGLTDEQIAQKVKEKYSLSSQDIEIKYQSIDEQNTQVTVFPAETKELYFKYSKELAMEFLGFAPVVLALEQFAKEKKSIVALKLPEQYIIVAVKDSGIYYTETVNSPDPVEFVARVTKALEFVRNKKEFQLEINKLVLVGFPKAPEIKLGSKISIIRKPLTIKNLTADSKALYLDSILSARLVVKDLPQEIAHENEEENLESASDSSEENTPANQIKKEKNVMPEEYSNENENEDTLRRLNDSRDYKYYDEETTSWKAWLVGVVIILIVLFLVVGVLARAGYLPFNVPFFSPSITTDKSDTLTPTPSPMPIVLATPTPTEASPSANVKKDEFSVQVQNGSGKAGAAGVVSKALSDAKFDTVSATNAPTEDYTSTEIYNVGKASSDFIGVLIAELKKAGYSATDKGTVLPTGVKTTADVVVILGAK